MVYDSVLTQEEIQTNYIASKDLYFEPILLENTTEYELLHSIRYSSGGIQGLSTFSSTSLENTNVSYVQEDVLGTTMYVGSYVYPTRHILNFQAPETNWKFEIVFNKNSSSSTARTSVFYISNPTKNCYFRVYTSNGGTWLIHGIPFKSERAYGHHATESFIWASNFTKQGLNPPYNQWGKWTLIFNKKKLRAELYYNDEPLFLNTNNDENFTDYDQYEGVSFLRDNTFTIDEGFFSDTLQCKIGWADQGTMTQPTKIASVDISQDFINPYIKKYDVPESQRTYSAYHSGGLNQSTLTSTLAWADESAKTGGWIKMDLGKLETVHGVYTIGRADAGSIQHVSRIKVETSEDDTIWTIALENIAANYDNATGVYNYFEEGVSARYVKITVLAYNSHPSTRCAVLMKMTTRLYDVPESQRTYNGNYPNLNKSMISSTSSWADTSQKTGGWIKMDLGKVSFVGGVYTVGRVNTDQFLTRIKVETSVDDSTWTVALEDVPANTNDSTGVYNYFENNVEARYVRITVVAYSGHPSTRAAVLLAL